MKIKLLVIFLIFNVLSYTQELLGVLDSITAPKGQFAVSQITTVNLTGDFTELVISVGFPDIAPTHNYPVLVDNPVEFPVCGENENEVLLSDLIVANGGSLPMDLWYEPAFDKYFDTHSGGNYTVDFNFLKPTGGGRYLTSHDFTYYVALNGGSDTNVIFNQWPEIIEDVAAVVNIDRPGIFDNIDVVHFTFENLPTNDMFHTEYGGTVGWSIT